MNYILYNRAEYFTQLAHDLHQLQTGDRALLATMSMDSSDTLVSPVVAAMGLAARRGATITLVVDAMPFLTSEKKVIGPLLYRNTLPDKLSEPFRSFRDTLNELERLGVRVSLVNIPERPFTLPFAGRSHIKTAIINNKLYLGGCNLDFHKHIDIMVSFTSSKAADWTYDWLSTLAKESTNIGAFAGKDRTISINAHTELFIDAGVPGQSTILETAYNLIENAQESIFMTCQFSPGGETAQHLLAAHHRGVDMQLYCSPARVHGLFAPGHFLHEQRERLRLPKSFYAYKLPAHFPKLHAKILASEKEIMFGSHNFVTQGVSLGTAEIAIKITDPELAETMRKFVRKQLAL